MVQAYRALMRATAVVATAVAVALLSGCPAPAPRASLPPRPAPAPSGSAAVALPTPAPPAGPPTTTAPPRAPTPQRENHLSPATRSLVAQAHTLLAHGDVDGASSTLDRALRIEPNNPLLWVELGRVRLAENDAHQAEGCGRKALALASGDRTAQSQAGHLLADALRAQQRNQEAHEVESQLAR